MSPLRFAIIAAMDQNRGIGINNKLPWRLKGDLEFFSRITSVAPPMKINAVIMGRKTWESLPPKSRPLPNRLNIVLTRQNYELPSDVLKAASLDETLEVLSQRSDLHEIFVIGGANVYEQAIQHPSCHKIYLTEVLGNFECDTFFPAIPQHFTKISSSEIYHENDLGYRFLVFESNPLP